MCNPIEVILVKPVRVMTPAMMVHVIEVDTPVLVDTENMVAYWEDEHFDIFKDEFAILN